MATRHIRRLQEQLKQTVASEEQQSEEAETEEETAGPAPFNPFDLLSDNDGPASGTEATEECDEAEEQYDDDGQPQQPQQSAQQQQKAAANGSSSSNRKKAKHKKSKGKQESAAGTTPVKPGSITKPPKASKTAAQQQQGQEEDIDKLLQELNIVPAVSGAQAAGSSTKTAVSSTRGGLPPLLGVDPRNIRGDAELRRMFGAGVVEAVDRADGAAAARRYGGAAASGRAAVRRRQLKKCLLVTPADHWPHVDSGISMKQTGTAADGTLQFCYSWSPNYSAAQRVFEQAQASYDPNAVAAVLHQFPYHVDSLLTMNELYRSMGEAQTADDMLARALYALESAWPSGFDPVTAAMRLDIERPENKGLFLALFRHAQALSRRGCHSSALEVTKLLLALDPEDPLGGLLLLDYLALRAGAYTYLERFVSEFDSSHSLALLPNYAFSLPMARYRLEQQQQQQQQSQGSSSSNRSFSVGSYTLLSQALLLYPLVLKELMSKLQSQGVGKDSSWTPVLARKLYVKANDQGSQSLSHLVSLFVERSHQLWKAADVQAWLKVAAEAAADVADGKHKNPSIGTVVASSSNRVEPDDILIEGSASDWACVACETFPASGRNEYGHLRLSDFSDTVNALPQEELQAALAAAAGRAEPAAQGQDMDAALDVLNDMFLPQQVAAAEGRAAPAVSDEEMRTANPLLMLLQSMLPWVNAGQQPDYEAANGQQQQQQDQQPGGDDVQ